MKKKINSSFSQWFWKEGKYIDFWNIPHLLFGALFFCICYLINLKLIFSLLFLVLIKICWEVYENNKVIKESLANSVLDVITGIIGFWISYHLIINNERIFKLYSVVILVAFIFFGIWGILNLDKSKRVK